MDVQRHRLRRPLTLTLYAALCLAPVGCTGFWDDVWSKDFTFKEWWTPPDPLVVLRDSTDGDRRARALAALGDPKRKPGTEKEEGYLVEILTTAASSERAALCRIAAIESLATFKDPRVVKALEDAYYRATSFQPETASIIRCRALAALGEAEQTAAIDILVRVLREPPVAAESSESEKQQKTDERTAAARALGHFKGRPAAEALVNLLKTEQDIALRDRAMESLYASTGKKFGSDTKLWDDYLKNAGQNQPVGVVEPKSLTEKIHEMVTPVEFH